MNEERYHLHFAEPVPTKILIEEDLYALDTLSDLLLYFIEKQPYDSKYFNDITMEAFKNISMTIKERVKERKIDYTGEKFLIMARGHRKISLVFKREPDIYIAAEYGLNFTDACWNYFSLRDRNKFNRKRNTYRGRQLYSLSVKDTLSYESGITKTGSGYLGWFKLSNQSFTLAEVEDKNDATLRMKILDKIIKNLLAVRITKP